MKIDSNTPAEYVSKLPEERQKPFKKVRSLIRKSLPKGHKESIKYGMISYDVPSKRNGTPNVSVSLGNQKSYMAMYFSNIMMEQQVKSDSEKNMRGVGRNSIWAKAV